MIRNKNNIAVRYFLLGKITERRLPLIVIGKIPMSDGADFKQQSVDGRRGTGRLQIDISHPDLLTHTGFKIRFL